MVSRYHEFRRSVLLARQAYVRETEPERLASYICVAARELVLLAGVIPVEAFPGEGRVPRLEESGKAEPGERARLLVRSRELAEQAGRLGNGEERDAWLRQAYQLVWSLDRQLVELAARLRNGELQPGSADVAPLKPVATAGMHSRPGDHANRKQ